MSVGYLTPTAKPLITSQNIGKNIDRLNLLSIFIITFVSVILFTMILLSIIACLHLKYQTSLKKCCITIGIIKNKDEKLFLNQLNSNGSSNSSTNTSNSVEYKAKLSTHGPLQKGFESMQTNILYPYTGNMIRNSFLSNNSNDTSSGAKRSNYLNDFLITSANNVSNCCNNKVMGQNDAQNIANNDKSSVYNSLFSNDSTYITLLDSLMQDSRYSIPYNE